MIKDFGVFILTNGRPNNVVTLTALRKCGYTGKVYLVVDDEDKKLAEYKKNFGDQVIVFNKLEIAEKFDSGDNFDDRRAIIYARNACFEIAKNLGIIYFLELDDDYPIFAYKFDDNLNYHETNIKNLDYIFSRVLEFYKSIPAKSVALAQNGDFIGGRNGGFSEHIKLRRKCMNTFFCSVDRPFKFIGRVNEDVNTYVRLGSVGDLFFTIPNLAIHQAQTQKSKGGMSELYIESGTYLKSFYSVMYNPSSVKVALMGDKHKRLHHQVSWKNAVPVILAESYRKKL